MNIVESVKISIGITWDIINVGNGYADEGGGTGFLIIK